MTKSTNGLGSITGQGKKGLWVASTGGHLEQLVRISNLSDYRDDSVWVTFDNHQSRSLLGERKIIHVDYVRPRGLLRAIKAMWTVLPALRRESFDFCISTGAALAAFILPISRLLGIRSIYIESVSRTAGPSLTGRLMAMTPGVETYTQHATWGHKNWKYIGSLLDNWSVSAVQPTERPLTIFITLGTIKPYKFDRAVDAVLKVLGPDDQVVWQLGATTRGDLPGDTYHELTADQVTFYIENSDVVVTHAGVGSIINILDAGVSPVLAVRSSVHKEHVDNHQQQIAETMVERGLAQTLNLEIPARSVLLEAASRSVKLQLSNG